MRAVTRLAAVAGLVLVAVLFFYRASELPEADVDERSFLDIPYRFATFGDLRYPVFIGEAFGGETVRPYPPINAFALRSATLGFVGFSAAKSRLLSAVLMGLVLLGAALWLRRRFAIDWSLAIVALIPAALAPAMILAARATRHEQEALFFGAISALILARGGLVECGPRSLALAGGFAAFASGMHPFGVVYAVSALVALLAVRKPLTLAPWFAGALIGASSTIWWLLAQGQYLAAAAKDVSRVYKYREEELVRKLSRFSSVEWLSGLGALPEALTARLASLQHAAFAERDGFPLELGAFSLLTRVLFWGEALCVAYFLMRHLRSPRALNHGAAWLSFLALAFLGFTVLYVPNTTYGLYGSFHIHVAFAAACLTLAAETPAFGVILRAVPAAVLALSLISVRQLVTAAPVIAFDHELKAIAEMARASGINPQSNVMTSMETWIAAGSRNSSLYELIAFGTGTSNPDALVYRRDHAAFFMGTTLPQEPSERARVKEERRVLFAKAHSELRLAGWLLLNEERGDAVYFFRRGNPRGVMIASIDPNRPLKMQTVAHGNDAPTGPRVVCDDQTVPLCVFLEN